MKKIHLLCPYIFTGLFKQQDLIHSSAEMRTEMYIRQANPETYRQVLRAIRQKEIYKIIVDTNPSNVKTFFRSVRIILIFYGHFPYLFIYICCYIILIYYHTYILTSVQTPHASSNQ